MEIEQAKCTIWGSEVSNEVFNRWTQGFIFSSDEPLLLVQHSGGPCAVLAPVQANILQKHLFESGLSDNDRDNDTWRKCTDGDSKSLLLSGLAEILWKTSKDGRCKVACFEDKTLNKHCLSQENPVPRNTYIEGENNRETKLKRKYPYSNEEDTKEGISNSKKNLSTTSTISNTTVSTSTQETTLQSHSSSGLITKEYLASVLRTIQSNDSQTTSLDTPVSNTSLYSNPHVTNTISTNTTQCENITDSTWQSTTVGSFHSTTDDVSQVPLIQGSPVVKRTSGPLSGVVSNFHLSIKIIDCDSVESAIECMKSNLDDLEGPFGVLLFLYSVVLTKGIDAILKEREEKEQPLIDPIHGHGSQSLINLLIVGHAVTNVFDLDKNLGGIVLRGIPHQSSIGFLTLLEALRYCQVGSFLKNPIYPIWLVGSETHLTVLFSTESSLISTPDSQAEARREFSRLDPEGIGLIDVSLLEELLHSLNIQSTPEHIAKIKDKLDEERSGVILLGDFLDEFFPKMDIDPPKVFPVYHYNGLHHCENAGFVKGCAIILDEAGGTNSEETLVNCLHTKWPSLVVHWDIQTDPKII